MGGASTLPAETTRLWPAASWCGSPRDWAKELNRAERRGPRGAIEHVVVYLSSTEEGAAILEALKRANISRGVREVVMTLAEKWKAEGIAEGKAQSLLMVLQRRFSEVPEESAQRVRTASAAQLDRWLARALTADSIDDVWD